MQVEHLTLKGSLNVILRDENGNIKDERFVDNLVVTAGLGYITERMVGTGSVVMSHMAIGTGSTAPAAGNTALVTQNARVALTSTTRVLTTVANDSVQYVASFPAGTGTGALREAGIFNDPSAGTMLCRTVYDLINKGELDSLTITWKVVIA
jgi:hypothetical protein